MTALEALERGYPRSREYRTQLIRLIEQTARCRNLSLDENLEPERRFVGLLQGDADSRGEFRRRAGATGGAVDHPSTSDAGLTSHESWPDREIPRSRDAQLGTTRSRARSR